MSCRPVAGEGRMTVNGFTVAAARSGGVSSYVYDTPNAEEVAVTVGGGLGESDIGGPVMNMVPRSGGNTLRRHRVPQHRRRLVARRQPDRRAQGAEPEPDADARHHPAPTTPAASFGGPIKKDRLWFYGSYRTSTRRRRWKASTPTPTPATPSRWDWVGSPIDARLVQDRQMIIGRLTGQSARTASASTPSTSIAARARRSRSRPRAATTAATTGSASATTPRRSSRRKRRRRRRAATSTCRST